MTDTTMVALSDLVFDERLYPRAHRNEYHVREIEHAIEAGVELPPVVVAAVSNIIVDGVHRVAAHQNQGRKDIAAIVKTYKSPSELWYDAVRLNAGVGLKLTPHDSVRVIQISQRLGLKEIDIAAMLQTSISHLRKIGERYATVEEAAEGVRSLRKVPLKASVRHLKGQTITPDQVTALRSAPGVSYLLCTNQLLAGLDYGLLPPEEAILRSGRPCANLPQKSSMQRRESLRRLSRGEARQGAARRGEDLVGLGMPWHGWVWHGKARYGRMR
jgi:hypothetical protein